MILVFIDVVFKWNIYGINLYLNLAVLEQRILLYLPSVVSLPCASLSMLTLPLTVLFCIVIYTFKTFQWKCTFLLVKFSSSLQVLWIGCSNINFWFLPRKKTESYQHLDYSLFCVFIYYCYYYYYYQAHCTFGSHNWFLLLQIKPMFWYFAESCDRVAP